MSTEAAAEQRDTMERLIGTVVSDKYRIDRLLGQGGMGAVYQATNLAIGKRVALKFLTREAARDRDAAERFQREALAASVVESTHIVQIFDSGTSEEGLPFLVMELLSGEDLRAKLKREGTLSIEETANIGAQVLRALVRAHAAGIVHRDLKPDNVYLCRRDDDSLFVKIVDFGISKLSRQSTLDTLTRRGTVLGTAYYMSPEQAQAYADIDGRTDLFSVGTILFECLTGRPPHNAPTYEAVLIAICTKDADDVRSLASAVPESLAQVIAKALARDRSERFQSASAMLDALLQAVPAAFVAPFGATPSGSSRTPLDAAPAESPDAFASTSRAPSTMRKKSFGTLVMATTAVLAGFALTAFWMKRSAAPERAEPVVATRLAAPLSPVPPESPAASPPPPASAVASTLPGEPLAPVPSATVPSVVRRSVKAPRKERPADAPNRPKAAGVAKSLQLSTKEP